MERISGLYNQGYRQALLDLREFMPSLIDDMKRYKIPVRRKRVEEMLDVYIQNRASMRERRGFCRWNVQEKRFEWYGQEERQKAAIEAIGILTDMAFKK